MSEVREPGGVTFWRVSKWLAMTAMIGLAGLFILGLWRFGHITSPVPDKPGTHAGLDLLHKTAPPVQEDAIVVEDATDTITHQHLISADPEEVEAADIHLKKCGLQEYRYFSETQAWLLEVNGPGYSGYFRPSKADALKENAAIQGIRTWALRQTDERVRAAYMEALQSHQDGVDEFLKELDDHHEQKHMAEFEAGEKDRDAKARAIQSKMPSPCHTPGKVK